MMLKVNAKGLSCPQPVLFTKKAIETMDSDGAVVLLDSLTSLENCKRYAEKLNCSTTVEMEDGEIRLILKKRSE